MFNGLMQRVGRALVLGLQSGSGMGWHVESSVKSATTPPNTVDERLRRIEASYQGTTAGDYIMGLVDEQLARRERFDRTRHCHECGADVVGNDPHSADCALGEWEERRERAAAEYDEMMEEFAGIGPEDETQYVFPNGEEYCEVCGCWIEDGNHDEQLHSQAFPF